MLLIGKWYLLEAQYNPTLGGWARKNGIEIPEDHQRDAKRYIRYMEIDAEARFDAVMKFKRRETEVRAVEGKSPGFFERVNRRGDEKINPEQAAIEASQKVGVLPKTEGIANDGK
ncbi:MAG: hypothetical protein FWC68_03775 [Oscillospiraceae bacterium]|nr:hypothetical protein [Oscillospiraceae bacterium]